MEYFNNEINISLLKNHILKDSISDWFNIYDYILPNKYKKDEISHYKEHILNESINYKHKLLNKLIEVSGIYTNINNKTVDETKHLILNNEPLIINGSLYSKEDNIYINCDIIIKYDHFKNIFPDITNIQFDRLYNDYNNYMLIDISYSTIKFKADLIDIINDGNILYKKCSLYAFQKAFNEFIGYKPYCFILGKQYQYKNNILPKKNFICNITIDNNIINKYRDALDWINYIKINYKNLHIYPNPNHSELYPNMNYTESNWELEKKNLAIFIKEITLVWNISYEERCNYIMNGIKCWDDKYLINNLKKTKRRDIQERMIHMNLNNDVLIYPRKNISQLLKNILELDGIYFDIESFIPFDEKQSFFEDINIPEEPIIAIIGFIYNNSYYNYTIQEYTTKDEERIIKLFSDKLFKLCNYRGNINIYHWGHAENNYFKYIYKKYPHIPFPKLNLINILDHFRSEPVIVQGVFKFGLKEIGNALYKNGLINTTWGKNDNGLDTMIRFKEICLERNKNIPLKRYNEISEIIEYNMIDCRVLFDIVEVLRKIYL